MTRSARTALLLTAAAGIGVLLVLAFVRLPHFGTANHPYGTRAIGTALADRHTANVVSSVNFDQRALDTLGEEFILFASVLGALVLLRPGRDEVEFTGNGDHLADRSHRPGQVLDTVRLLGYLLLPVTMLVGWYIVVHGAITPGGGFQGGIVLATGLHLLYLAGDYRALRALRPIRPFDVGEAVAAGAFVLVGLAGTVLAGGFLTNFLPTGVLRSLASGGTVPLLNTVVGIEVAAGLVLLLARFFEQDLRIRSGDQGGA
ncbi:MAG TPA: MnhB domain-containing protein [Mycobacteriales bacterium]